MTSGKKKAAVIGWPVAQSLSPTMVAYWLNKYGIQGRYDACAVPPEELQNFARSLKEGAYHGVNVTIPHKEKIIPFLDSCDDVASAIGAVNAVTVENGKLTGTNTDVYGFLEHLRQSVPSYNKQHAIVLGAGGAARAVCKALDMDGFSEILICARDVQKAETIKHIAHAKVKLHAWDDYKKLLPACNLLVNTTPLGMKGKDSLSVNISALPKEAVVYDIVYNPLMTTLLKQAQTRGFKVVDGLGMLMHQAVPCFEAWFSKRPQVTAELREHLLEHLQ